MGKGEGEGGEGEGEGGRDGEWSWKEEIGMMRKRGGMGRKKVEG